MTDAEVVLNVSDNLGNYIWYKDGTATGETTASINVTAELTTDADGNLRQRTAAEIVAAGGGVTANDGDAWGVTGEDQTSVITRTGDVVINNANRTALTLQTSDNTTPYGLAFRNSGGNYTWNILREPAPSNSNLADLVFSSGSTGDILALQERMRIESGGNVGIGSSAPGGRLTVQVTASGAASAASNSVQFRADGAGKIDFFPRELSASGSSNKLMATWFV